MRYTSSPPVDVPTKTEPSEIATVAAAFAPGPDVHSGSGHSGALHPGKSNASMLPFARVAYTTPPAAEGCPRMAGWPRVPPRQMGRHMERIEWQPIAWKANILPSADPTKTRLIATVGGDSA